MGCSWFLVLTQKLVEFSEAWKITFEDWSKERSFLNRTTFYVGLSAPLPRTVRTKPLCACRLCREALPCTPNMCPQTSPDPHLTWRPLPFLPLFPTEKNHLPLPCSFPTKPWVRTHFSSPNPLSPRQSSTKDESRTTPTSFFTTSTTSSSPKT